MQADTTILFATDFSLASKIAMRTLTNLNQTYPMDIHLLHVIPSFWQAWFGGGLKRKEVMQRLLTWQKKLSPQTQDTSKLIVDKGDAAEAICHHGVQTSANVVAIGAGDYAKGTGHVAKRVVREAQQSVLVCKHEAIQSVLCGIDGSEHSRKVLRNAINIARVFQAKLCVVHVISGDKLNKIGMDEQEISKKEEAYKQQRIQALAPFLQEFDFSGLEVEYHYPWGNPARVIQDLADDFDYDLIVVGARGENPVTDLLLGSVPVRMVETTPCSLLVVR
jgi:nucleotide-binding universal stress UspA family protein